MDEDELAVLPIPLGGWLVAGGDGPPHRFELRSVRFTRGVIWLTGHRRTRKYEPAVTLTWWQLVARGGQVLLHSSRGMPPEPQPPLLAGAEVNLTVRLALPQQDPDRQPRTDAHASDQARQPD